MIEEQNEQHKLLPKRIPEHVSACCVRKKKQFGMVHYAPSFFNEKLFG
jgi:hypothetical protein